MTWYHKIVPPPRPCSSSRGALFLRANVSHPGILYPRTEAPIYSRVKTPLTLWSQDISFQVHTQLAIVGVVLFLVLKDETIFGAVEKYYHSKS